MWQQFNQNIPTINQTMRILPGLNTEALKYDASLSPHTVVVSVTFETVVRLVKTLLSYAVYHPGDTRSRSRGFQNASFARTLCLLIISLFVNSHKIVQELYAFHFTWIKDQRVETWNALCHLSFPVPVSSRQQIYSLVMVKRPLKTEASGEMESVMTMKLSLAHTSQMPLTTLDHRRKIRSGVTNSNKCGLLKKRPCDARQIFVFFHT